MAGALIELEEKHRELIHHLRRDAESWLYGKGIDQYQRGPRAARAHADLDELLDSRRFVGLELDGRVVAVATLTDADPDFWTEEERQEPAAYVGRFMVAEHGHDYGSTLLELIIEQLRRTTDAKVLRLDCWRTNTALQAYYLARGFHHVRTEVVPGRMSGALFERPISDMQ